MSDAAHVTRPLLGYFSEAEVLDFYRSRCISKDLQEERILQLHKQSRNAIAEKSTESLLASTSEIQSEYKPQLDEISKHGRFAECVERNTWSFRYIEIDKLVSYQTHVSETHARRIAANCNMNDPVNLIRFCLSDDFLNRRFEVDKEISAHEFRFFAEGQDLRVLKADYEFHEKSKSASVSFDIGWGAPFVQVVKFADRFFLKNGYHRAFAVRESGHTRLPCILIEGKTLADIGNPGPPGFFSSSVVLSKQPPVFADFLSKSIAPPVQVRTVGKVIFFQPYDFVLELAEAERYLEPSKASEATGTVTPTGAMEELTALKEEWNIYRLSDGNLLKIRQLLTRARTPTAEEQTRIQIDPSPLVVAVIPAKTVTGTHDSRISFKVMREPINEYVTKDGRKILFHLKLKDVSKTDKFDEYGLPVYSVNALPKLTVLLPKKPSPRSLPVP